MNKLTLSIGLIASILCISACNFFSSIVGVPMDSSEAWSMVQSIVEENLDAKEWRLVGIEVSQDKSSGKELDNNLSYCTLKMLDKEGKAWTQTIFLKGVVGDLNREDDEKTYTDIPTLDIKAITPEQYAKHIQEAKDYLQTNYEGKLNFKCVDHYTIDNTIATDEGGHKWEFSLNVTEKDSKPVQNAGHMVTEYYEVPFVVGVDGSVMEKPE